MSGITAFHPSRSDQGRRYDAVARSFHWGIVALLVVQYVTKWLPKSVASEDALNAWHLAIGPTILVLMLLRLVWRLGHRPPPPPGDLSLALQFVSRATHWAFYGLLIMLPLLGWASASAFGATPYLLGLIPLPALVGRDEKLAESIGGVHGLLALALLALIALHIAGALFHLIVKRDGVFQRMLPPGRHPN